MNDRRPLGGQRPRVRLRHRDDHDHRISIAGTGALLLTFAGAEFDLDLQRRLWSLARSLRAVRERLGVLEAVPGVNNLLLVFDPLRLSLDDARALLTDQWRDAEPLSPSGREVEIAALYGGPAGPDLVQLARDAGLTPEEAAHAHAAAEYVVACLGGYPGFPYLAGLPKSLRSPRRSSPRGRVAAGSLIVGSAQASVMPCAGPSGWHVIGATADRLFDPGADPPCLLAPGDRVRFRVIAVER